MFKQQLRLPQLWKEILRVFDSAKYAALNFILLAGIGGIAIVYEKNFGLDQTRVFLFSAIWFNGLLILVALNGLIFIVRSCVLKRSRRSMLIAYAGLTIFLMSIVIGNLYGFEGYLALMEGEAGKEFLIQKVESLHLAIPSNNYSCVIPIVRDGNVLQSPNKSIRLTKGIEVQLQKVFPYTHREMEVHEGGFELNPAIQLNIESSSNGVHQNEWLFSKVDSRNQIDIGPAVFRYMDSRALLDKGLLRLKFDDQEFECPVERHIGKKIHLKNDASLFIRNYFLSFKNNESTLFEDSENSETPAVILELDRPAGKSFHCVIANRSDQPVATSAHGAHEGVDISYQRFFPSEKPEIVFSRDVMGVITYWVYGKKLIRRSGVVETGKEIDTGWLDLKVKVNHTLEYCTLVQRIVADEKAADSHSQSSLGVIVSRTMERQHLMLGWETPQSLMLKGEQIIMSYGPKVIPLGFKVRCEELALSHHEDSYNPSKVTSKLIIEDSSRGLIQKASITKNHPFYYRGYQIQQLSDSDSLSPGSHQIFLQVKNDPGRFGKLVGIILTVIGISGLLLSPRRIVHKKRPLLECSRTLPNFNLQPLN